LSRLSYLFSKVAILTVLSAIQTALFVWIGNSILEIRGMSAHYWLILFSTSFFANLLGLLISDSLKKSVNIYILIPFLVIPQLILSGVFVGYDRMNPNISSPSMIPWYGEVVTSRWAFEAIAVHQFSKNKYEVHFFETDKLKSQASFMKEYWVPAMEVKVSKCKNALLEHEMSDAIDDWTLIRNELSRSFIHSTALPYNYTERVSGDVLPSKAFFDNLIVYLEKVKAYYRNIYNRADSRQDSLKVKWSETPEKRAELVALKEKYYNEDLERFVKNTNNFFSNKIIENNGRLIQKTDPVFCDPNSGLFNAHYFAPYKTWWGIELPTYIANLLVIWMFNTLIFIAVYFRLLAKLMSLGTSAKSYKKNLGAGRSIS
jgi:hypothetical protein